ncbi:MAG: rhomboid family intramembrane serine protease [Gammaproteobacteria bacterium]|nr:rhomboid family intramembrane serine protease [Gammaproteobacteria bacterium]
MNDLLNGLLYRHGTVPRLTLVLIAISAAVSAYSGLGDSLGKLVPLLMSEYRGNSWETLVEIRNGELWRLITPIFVHFGLLHLLFNMMWLWDLGGVIETRWSALQLSALVLVIGVSSNLAQYLMEGALFGGMSGVVYGLLAYLYILGRLRPDLGLHVPQAIMSFMLIWFALCWTGLLGGIANWAHTFGLVSGGLLALGRSQLK